MQQDINTDKKPSLTLGEWPGQRNDDAEKRNMYLYNIQA